MAQNPSDTNADAIAATVARLKALMEKPVDPADCAWVDDLPEAPPLTEGHTTAVFVPKKPTDTST
jgi:hypothetical protein